MNLFSIGMAVIDFTPMIALVVPKTVIYEPYSTFYINVIETSRTDWMISVTVTLSVVFRLRISTKT